MEEEKEAEKKAEESALAEESKKDTIGGMSDVATPRSESDVQDAKAKAELDEDSKDDKAKKDSETTTDLKESYGLDSLKFKNASIRGKNNSTHSPML